MAKGWVTTARGESLNIDQLITESKRPPGLKEENTEIKKRVIPKKRILNVRGFKPDTGAAEAPEMSAEMKEMMEARNKRVPEVARKVAYREGGVAESYSDLTGVKLKVTEQAKQRQKARLAKEHDTHPDEMESEKDETFDDIMGELASHEEDIGMEPEPEKPTPRRRAPRKKTTTK